MSHIWKPLATFSFICLAVRTVAARASRSPDSTRVSCRGGILLRAVIALESVLFRHHHTLFYWELIGSNDQSAGVDVA